MRLLVVSAVSAMLGLTLLSCSIFVDTSFEDGYRCEQEHPRCLDGYDCIDGICVERPDDPSYDPCQGACGPLERCDMDTAKCVPLVCRTGEVALEAAGRCEPIVGGLGQLCDRDQDCEDLLPNCTTDPSEPGSVVCTCVVPATMASPGDTSGVCLGLPVDPTDCHSCGDAECIFPEVSSAGEDGWSAERAVCAPPGFGTCGSDEDCHHSDEHTVCTYFGWPSDPEDEGYPEGLFAACATPSWNYTLGYGDPCEPSNPLACDTGICVPITQGRHVCSLPCDSSSGCGGETISTCLDAVVDLGPAGSEAAWDIAPVCGQGPTLGEECEPVGDLDYCGTDAPLCTSGGPGGIEFCSRECRKDTDCGQEPFVCLSGGTCGFSM